MPFYLPPEVQDALNKRKSGVNFQNLQPMQPPQVIAQLPSAPEGGEGGGLEELFSGIAGLIGGIGGAMGGGGAHSVGGNAAIDAANSMRPSTQFAGQMGSAAKSGTSYQPQASAPQQVLPQTISPQAPRQMNYINPPKSGESLFETPAQQGQYNPVPQQPQPISHMQGAKANATGSMVQSPFQGIQAQGQGTLSQPPFQGTQSQGALTTQQPFQNVGIQGQGSFTRPPFQGVQSQGVSIGQKPFQGSEGLISGGLQRPAFSGSQVNANQSLQESPFSNTRALASGNAIQPPFNNSQALASGQMLQSAVAPEQPQQVAQNQPTNTLQSPAQVMGYDPVSQAYLKAQLNYRKQFGDVDYSKLQPGMVDKTQAVFNDLRAQGFDPVVAQATRTQAQANANARAGVGIKNSLHVKGQAADIVDARYGWDGTRGFNQQYANAIQQSALKNGLYSGVPWKERGEFGDFAHVQTPDPRFPHQQMAVNRAQGSSNIGSQNMTADSSGMISGAIPQVGNNMGNNDLGFVSRPYESGDRGVNMISSGKGDPGGVSYGAHQLASKTGTMGAYLKQSSVFGPEFKGLKPGTSSFNQKYKEIATSRGDEFAADQKAYLDKTHYSPVREYATSLGYPDNQAVNESLYSMSIQHGGAKKIVADAKSRYSGEDPTEIVNSLYDARTDYVKNLSKMPSKTKQSILNRYKKERQDVLKLLK